MKAGNILVDGKNVYYYDPDCVECGDPAEGIMVGEDLPDDGEVMNCRPLCAAHREESDGDDWRKLEEI